MSKRKQVKFTPVRPIAAEGARIGVVTCLTCGATVNIDPDDEKDALGLHRDWHRRLGDTPDECQE